MAKANVELYCPFCKAPLEYRVNSRFWCQNCKRLWKIELIEQYIAKGEKENGKNE